MFICSICDKEFQTVGELQEHQDDDHFTEYDDEDDDYSDDDPDDDSDDVDD